MSTDLVPLGLLIMAAAFILKSGLTELAAAIRAHGQPAPEKPEEK